MLERLKEGWHYFKTSPPGRRFQRQYERRHQTRQHPFQKMLFLGGGLFIMAAGVFFLPAPGPGMVILALGAALVAQESLAAARVLDRAELLGRRLLTWSEGVWRGAGGPLKALIVLGAVALAGLAAFGAYRMLFG